MITPKYSVEWVDDNEGVAIQVALVGRYKEARRFIADNPIKEEGKHYRIMRTDYIEDEELEPVCVYEQGVSTYIEEWEE